MKIGKLIGTSLIAISLLANLAFASEPTTAESGTILNLSGRQRMLTQKMTKELVFAALDHNKEANLAAAIATAKLFDDTLIGLRDGNADMGLPATTDERILRQIGKVEELWASYKSVVEGIAAKGSVAADDVAKIAELNLPLLAEMNKCVTLYERQARGSAMSGNPALAVAVNLAGKQRMLSQRMTKEMLLLSYGHQPDENQILLTESYDLFDRTLTGLEHGDSVLELSPDANTPEVVAQLNVVGEIWAQFMPLARATANQKRLPASEYENVEKLNMTLLKEMNKAVGMYESLTH